MTGIEIGLLGFLALFVLLAIRVPVGTAMMVVGFFGMLAITPRAALPILAGEVFNISTVYSLTILPLFVLMGNLAGISGMSRDLYDAAHGWFGHFRGGLASSTIVGCAGFSALSGSSLASAVTMGRVALPEMQRYRYDNALATGSIAAGGTLGILIPPSAGFVVYAILTEVSIGRLFMAGVLPGILLSGLFVLAIWLMTVWKPHLAPGGADPAPLADRFRALGRASWIIGIILITIGGIYLGVFSAVEAAGHRRLPGLPGGAGPAQPDLVVGEGGAGPVPALDRHHLFHPDGRLRLHALRRAHRHPVRADRHAGGLGAHPYAVLLIVLAFFIVLGTFLEGFAILVLALPLVQPIMEAYGFDMVWFGVLMVIVLEMGLISPPVGINVFVVKGVAPDVPMNTIFRGIWPFWFAMLLAIAILVAVPEIALLLPNTMFG